MIVLGFKNWHLMFSCEKYLMDYHEMVVWANSIGMAINIVVLVRTCFGTFIVQDRQLQMSYTHSIETLKLKYSFDLGVMTTQVELVVSTFSYLGSEWMSQVNLTSSACRSYVRPHHIHDCPQSCWSGLATTKSVGKSGPSKHRPSKFVQNCMFSSTSFSIKCILKCTTKNYGYTVNAIK